MARAPARLPRSFFARPCLEVAPELLGLYLVHGERAGRIVEVEAYVHEEDQACHARFGRTKRSELLYGPPGHAYVFLIYGMYDCFNVVCGGAKQRGHAVLVRGVEPVLGIEEEARTDGPGRLSRAMAITREQDAVSLLGETLFLARGPKVRGARTTPRVGVAYAGEDADLEYRFFDPSSRCVSRPSASAIGRAGIRSGRSG